MALVPSSSQPHFAQTRLDLASIHSLISQVNHHLNHLLSHPIARDSLHHKSRAILSTSTSPSNSFQIADQSVLSSLYYGIKSAEVAAQCNSADEKNSRLLDSEKMLQLPALQEEEGNSDGVDNRLVVSLAYFYLSLLKKLQGDRWQMTIHFLQSVSVHSQLVRTDLAPALWESVFGVCAPSAGRMVGEESDDMAKCQARRYKSWLMYYQVVSYGDTTPWIRNCYPGPNNHESVSTA